MTDGHKHRLVTVKSFDTWWVQWLRLPLLHHDASNPAEMEKIDASPYPYGPCPLTDAEKPTCWVLTPLGILHRWTGLTLFVPDPHHCCDETCEEAHP